MKETREQGLRKELKILNTQYKQKEKSIHQSPEHIWLEKREKELEKRGHKLYDEETKIEEKIKLLYLYDTENPCYKPSQSIYGGYNGERNIRPEVLISIKRTLGITNISHLRASQINEATQKLIDIDMEKSEELKKVREESEKVSEEEDEMKKKIDEIEEDLNELYNRKWEVEKKINKIKELKQKEKDKKNPKKMSKIKKWEKEEEAQKKMDKINLEEVRIGVTKEKILNNLEYEDEED
ncbi:hypothetical protein LCGC14_2181090 [marine sediment metagenome]|uniref:Uncharacterized protein n=1 Tax=marine sediment metagenome TaxID=412755 RepID=A0A0F8XJF3_9ZZZZ